MFFFQAEDGIRDLVRSRGLGDVYKRQRDEIDFVAEVEVDGGRGVFDAIGDFAHRDILIALSLIHI